MGKMFEYKVIFVSDDVFEQTLNFYGGQGWRPLTWKLNKQQMGGVKEYRLILEKEIG